MVGLFLRLPNVAYVEGLIMTVHAYTRWLKKVSCCTVSTAYWHSTTAYFFEPPCTYERPLCFAQVVRFSLLFLFECRRRRSLIRTQPNFATMQKLAKFENKHKKLWAFPVVELRKKAVKGRHWGAKDAETETPKAFVEATPKARSRGAVGAEGGFLG